MRVCIIIGIMLILNAGVFFYAWDQGKQTAVTACQASAQISQEVREVYQRNLTVTYPELYRQDVISIEGLGTLTTSAVRAIYRLSEAERKCIEATQ